MPVSKALFSRVTGPGMVAPSITAALEEPAGGKKRGRGVEVRADASTAATKTTPGGRAVFDAEYPWEKRAWTALDFYAGVQRGLAYMLPAVPAALPAAAHALPLLGGAAHPAAARAPPCALQPSSCSAC